MKNSRSKRSFNIEHQSSKKVGLLSSRRHSTDALFVAAKSSRQETMISIRLTYKMKSRNSTTCKSYRKQIDLLVKTGTLWSVMKIKIVVFSNLTKLQDRLMTRRGKRAQLNTVSSPLKVVRLTSGNGLMETRSTLCKQVL